MSLWTKVMLVAWCLVPWTGDAKDSPIDVLASDFAWNPSSAPTSPLAAAARYRKPVARGLSLGRTQRVRSTGETARKGDSGEDRI
jgi:hypothetical protein